MATLLGFEEKLCGCSISRITEEEKWELVPSLFLGKLTYFWRRHCGRPMLRVRLFIHRRCESCRQTDRKGIRNPSWNGPYGECADCKARVAVLGVVVFPG